MTSIDVAVRTTARVPGYRFTRRAVPPEYVMQAAGLRVTTPAWTALDLVSTDGADAIDEALRSRAVRLPELWDAFRSGSGRAGNRERMRLLLDSRDGAWSPAERLAHRLLRRHRISGWQANYPARVNGRCYYLDIAFPELRLVVEIDGYAYHGPDRFESDRQRQNDLVLAGWTVLRITWRMLTEEPHAVIARITAAMSQTRRDQQRNPRIRRA